MASKHERLTSEEYTAKIIITHTVIQVNNSVSSTFARGVDCRTTSLSLSLSLSLPLLLSDSRACFLSDISCAGHATS